MKYVLSLVICFSFCFPSAALSPRNLTSLEDWDAFAGVWQIAGSPIESEKAIKSAIEKATEKMSFITRGIAREKLRSPLKVSNRIRMQRQNKTFIIHPDAYIAMNMPISGEAVKLGDRNFRVLLEAGGGRHCLHQIAENTQGKRENFYRLQNGGKSLELEVIVTSSQLPAPVQFKQQFTRVE